MTDLILHLYAASLFADKARLVLGFEQLTWGSLDMPVIPRIGLRLKPCT